MNGWPLWAVLTPGEPSRLEFRVRAALMLVEDEQDRKVPPFEILAGSGHYHAIIGVDPADVGVELQIAKELSLEVNEPVYSIERSKEPWAVNSWRNGTLETEEMDPEVLAKTLGCPLPGGARTSEQAARKPLRTVALLEGIQAAQAHRTLEEDLGKPLPAGRYRFEDTPQGLLLSGGTGGMNFAHISLSERFPQAIVYGVTASPGLDTFSITVMRAGEGIERFTRPLRPDPCVPEVSNIKGESSPERILAALGIPAVWFRNE